MRWPNGQMPFRRGQPGIRCGCSADNSALRRFTPRCVGNTRWVAPMSVSPFFDRDPGLICYACTCGLHSKETCITNLRRPKTTNRPAPARTYASRWRRVAAPAVPAVHNNLHNKRVGYRRPSRPTHPCLPSLSFPIRHLDEPSPGLSKSLLTGPRGGRTLWPCARSPSLPAAPASAPSQRNRLPAPLMSLHPRRCHSHLTSPGRGDVLRK